MHVSIHLSMCDMIDQYMSVPKLVIRDLICFGFSIVFVGSYM